MDFSSQPAQKSGLRPSQLHAGRPSTETRLAKRNERGAKKSLQQSDNYDLGKRLRDAAQHRCPTRRPRHHQNALAACVWWRGAICEASDDIDPKRI
jgi:hypothetical protein